MTFQIWPPITPLAHPLIGINHLASARPLNRRAWSISVKVAALSLGAITAVCREGYPLTCLVGTIGSLMVLVFSGFQPGKTGSLEGGINNVRGPINHVLPNGTTLLSRLLPRTDDNPDDTQFIDVLYNDLDIGRRELRNDGGAQGLSNQVAEKVGSTMINQQAETVCAALTNLDTNSEILAAECSIKAGDGSEGTQPSGACDCA
jgi:hypothetical protein